MIIGSGWTMMKSYRSKDSLPKWAQQVIEDQERRITELSDQLETMKAMRHFVSTSDGKSMTWFRINNYNPDPLKLWIWNNGEPHCIATLAKGDALFVGRLREEEGTEN